MASRRNPPHLRAALGAHAVMLGMLAPAAAAEPARIIFDTEMDSDCDDAGALAMLHALADRGEAEILATLVSSHHPWSAACVDAINTWFGRPDLPVGAPSQPGRDQQGSRFAKRIAEEFPHDTPPDAVPDATQIYRRVLAGQATRGTATSRRWPKASKPARWRRPSTS